MLGSCLSTFSPVTGPAVVQLLAMSQTCREPVVADEVSVPSLTDVDSTNDPSAVSAKPLPSSEAVQLIWTSSADQAVGAGAQSITGGC